MIKFYRKQPIEAEQFTKENELYFIEKYGLELFEYVSIGGGPNIPVDHAGDGCMVYLTETKEGKMHVVVGDWFVKEADEIRVMTDEEFKQQYAELPVIPKNVAYVIKQAKKDNYKLGWVFYAAYTGLWLDSICNWIRTNADIFSRAWIDGYVVEE